MNERLQSIPAKINELVVNFDKEQLYILEDIIINKGKCCTAGSCDSCILGSFKTDICENTPSNSDFLTILEEVLKIVKKPRKIKEI